MKRLVLVLALASLLGMGCRTRKKPVPAPVEHVVDAPPPRPKPVAPTAPAPTLPGSDPLVPMLAPGDESFVDTRGGWGWGDRCWLNIKARRWGYAKAECDQGMRMKPASPQPLASLLYNEGLIAEAAGDLTSARADFEASLRLREHPDVRAAWSRVVARGVIDRRHRDARRARSCLEAGDRREPALSRAFS